MQLKRKNETSPSIEKSLDELNNKMKTIINILNLQQQIMVDVFEEFSKELKKSKKI